MVNESQSIIIDKREKYIKLESIFLPRTRERRQRFYETAQASPDGIQTVKFVHYTSAEALLNIIRTKCLWLRNSKCMVDYREIEHGHDLLLKYFNASEFTKILDEFTSEAGTKGIKLFDQWWNNGIAFQTYLACVSQHKAIEDDHGRLSMWRAFGGNSARVAIVFNVPWFSEGAQALKVSFSPVSYLTESAVKESLAEVMQNIRDNASFLSSIDSQEIISHVFSMLHTNSVCQKHESFLEEEEWRVIYSPMLFESQIIKSSVEVIGGIPQRIFKLPLDASVSPDLKDLDFAEIFDRIIIGPTPYSWPMCEAFIEELVKAGVNTDKQRVFMSQIPIRA